MPLSSERSQFIKPFQVMAILAEAQKLESKGVDVIHLEVGEPDFPTPEPIVNAGLDALKRGKTHYTPALGIPALREKIADYYDACFGVSVSPERIVLTPGASGALLLLTAARLNPGDGLLLADPGYPCNRHFARLFEAYGQLVPASAKDKYQLTPHHISEYWQSNTKAALVATPSNPTGTVLTVDELQALSQSVKVLGGELWVDEIYQGLNYGIEPHTVLSCCDDAIVLNSFSKFFGMTGWRLGWMVVPEQLVPTLDTLAQNLFLAPSTPAQYAALAAFEPETLEILEQRRQTLAQRREYMLAAVSELGFSIPISPEGAFYIYADASRFTDNSLEFCSQLLQETGVAITPGVDFGEYQANSHVRFAFTTGLPRLKEAIKRIKEWL